jgi:transcriptional regulator with XRE-family HTH domain
MKINTKPRNQKLVKKIGLRISILRNVRGMSRLKLAEAAQISVRKIREYESGNKAMTIDELATISDVLQMEAFQFFL